MQALIRPEAESIGSIRHSVLEEYARLMRVIHFARPEPVALWSGVDLTMPQFRVLWLLAGRPDGLRARELAAALGVGPSAVTALVERLAEPGYVRREDDPHDRRITWIRLTESGRAIVERVAAGQRERLDAILAQLEPAQLQSVEHALRLLREAGERLAAHQNPDARL